MAQTTPLLDTLKKALKAHGKTYADVARQLDLTEASVKRIFSEKHLSLQRLDRICQMLDMEITDLVMMMSENTSRTTQLTQEQEQEIANDVELLLVAVCVLNRWAMEEIMQHYDISETCCIRHLAKLDRLKIIELLPKNRVKLRVAPNFSWLENGPIQRFFREKVESDFFNSRFDRDTEQMIVINGMLSRNSNAVFQRKMERLAKEFDELNNDDTSLELGERFGTTVVLAMRQWKYGVFEKLRKKPS